MFRVDEQQQIRQAVLVFRVRQQSIHLREKNIAGPTERSRNAKHFASSQERDQRFSMKMILCGRAYKPRSSLSDLILRQGAAAKRQPPPEKLIKSHMKDPIRDEGHDGGRNRDTEENREGGLLNIDLEQRSRKRIGVHA